MELSTYAEQILFGTRLEDKLVSPGKIRDARKRPPVAVPDGPGRPDGLEMMATGKNRARFPGFGALQAPEARGKALHFFANHELLALELMALALLRFPEADPTWRRTVFATMRDEQKHLSLYLKRMGELGVQWGEIPLNRFFWDHLSTMASPTDYAVRMSLTFEQANLDFSLTYRDAFRAHGDTHTADLMQQVLDDEVVHVRHGVRALNAWKGPNQTLWHLYSEALPYPLTPARAKGMQFSVEVRQKAELPEDFISGLQHYRHTRGRPPVVRLFNPATEAALGHGVEGFTPNRAVLTLSRDLETLPLLLSATDDVVLVRNRPSLPHLARLEKMGWPQPEWMEAPLDRAQLPPDHPLCGRPIAGVEPWGWDPSVTQFLAPLWKGTESAESGVPPVPERQREWSSKGWLADLLPGLLKTLPPAWQESIESEQVAQSLNTVEEADAWLARNLGHTGKVVFKAPFGTAGRDAIRVESAPFPAAQRKWVERTLETQGAVVAECWHERVVDLSFQFRVPARGAVRPVGLTRFFTDSRGQYRGSLVAPLSTGLNPDVQQFLFAGGGKPWAMAALEQLALTLGRRLQESGFRGRAGMDAMVIRTPAGPLRLRAPLELNPRPTMGHIALAAAKPFGSRAVALWTLLTPPLAKQCGLDSAHAHLRALQAQLPEKREKGKIVQGVFPVNDPDTAEAVLGVLLAAPAWETLQGLGVV